MDLRLGGKIAFDDAEGTTYEATITELEKPYLFVFREVDDLDWKGQIKKTLINSKKQ